MQGTTAKPPAHEMLLAQSLQSCCIADIRVGSEEINPSKQRSAWERGDFPSCFTAPFVQAKMLCVSACHFQVLSSRRRHLLRAEEFVQGHLSSSQSDTGSRFLMWPAAACLGQRMSHCPTCIISCPICWKAAEPLQAGDQAIPGRRTSQC